MLVRPRFTASLLLALALVSGAGVPARAAIAPATPTYLLGWGGTGSGPGQFNLAYGAAVDANGDVYIADSANQRIQKFDPLGNLILQWGSPGSGNGQFNYPDFLAIDAAGNVYVSDYFNNRVQKFTSTGTYLAQFGSVGTGNGQFNGCEGLAIDRSGNIYVGDYNGNRVQKFSSSGTYLTQWGTGGTGNGQFNGAEGVAVDRAGNVYVGDYNNNRIEKFSSTGTYLAQWGTLGTGNGQLNQPGTIALDAVGNILVADYGNNRVQKFDATGAYLAQWGSLGTAAGQFTAPWGLAVDPAGDVYVTEWGGPNRVQKFSGGGASLLAPASPHPDQFAWRAGSYGSGPGQLGLAYGVAVGTLGQVFVADSPNARVERFTSTGLYVSQWGTPGTGNGQFGGASRSDVATDGVGFVYVCDPSNTRIQKFTETGTYVTQWSVGFGSFPWAIAIDAAGNVYVVDLNNHRIDKYTSTGTFVTTWGSNGTGAGQFSFPTDVAVDPAGNVYVTDGSNNNVQKFSGTGTYLGQWGSLGSGNGQFNDPNGIALDAAGYVYVADAGNGRIQVFTTAGAYVTQFATPNQPITPTYQPAGMAVDATGDLYVLDVTDGTLVKYAPPQPRILAVSDVGNDQGGKVQLRVHGSAEDAAGTGMTITGYAVYRRNDPAPAFASPGGAASAQPSSIEMTGWTYVGSFPAHGESEYSVIVPTAANYTSATSVYTNAYMVRALTADPLTYIDSAVEYGYSIDNLTPPPPTSLAAQYAPGATDLRWDASPAPDVAGFRLYRGTSADFATGAASLVATVTGTSYADAAPHGCWYKLSAVDVNENESACAVLSPAQIASGPPAAPLVFALDGVRPNPATGRDLTVRFVLPVASPARLELLDVAGRSLVAREVGALGAGAHTLDLTGAGRVPPGLYFVRLQQGTNKQVARVTVLE